MRRRALLLTGLTLAFVLATAVAEAKFRGSDMWSNLVPGGGDGGLVDRYPISRYQLDYHVDNGITGLGDPGDTIAQFTASWLFFLSALAMRVVIAIFDWSFHVDVLTGDHGLLGLSSPIAQHYYQDVVMPFLVSTVIAFGVWVAYKAVKHQHAEVGGALVRVTVMSVLAIAVLQYPQETVGRVYGMVASVGESVATAGQGHTSASDRVFETFIYRPWVVLQFSGLRVCTGAKHDQDGFPLAASASNPATTCHSALRQGADGHGDYARRFLRYGHGTDERNAEYDALRSGSSPGGAQFAGTTIDRTDAPAVDMMQAEGAVQRLIYTVLIVFGMVGGVLLLGLLSVAALFMQLAVAMLFLATPFMVLVALLPPAHFVFERWGGMLGKALVGSLFYDVLLAVVLATSDGLVAFGDAATDSTPGYFLAFAGQAILFWGAFLMRKRILESVSSKAAHHYDHHESQAVSFVGGAAVGAAAAISGGTTEFAAAMRSGWKGDHAEHEEKDEHHPDSVSPPASAGREHSPPAAAEQEQQVTSTGQESSAPAETISAEEEPMPTPTTFREHLQSARQAAPPPASSQQESPAPVFSDPGELSDVEPVQDDQAPSYSPTAHTTSPPRGLATPQSFQEDLELAALVHERPLPTPPDPWPFERGEDRDRDER